MSIREIHLWGFVPNVVWTVCKHGREVVRGEVNELLEKSIILPLRTNASDNAISGLARLLKDSRVVCRVAIPAQKMSVVHW